MYVIDDVSLLTLCVFAIYLYTLYCINILWSFCECVLLLLLLLFIVCISERKTETFPKVSL